MKNYKVALLTLTLSLLIFTPSSQANQPQQQISFLHKLDTLLNTTATWLTNYTNPYDDENLDFSTPLVAAGIICFLAASISSAGGIGGGGLFIPILTLVAGLDLRTASGFSAFMVTGGSVANVMYNMYLKGGKSLIDYDVALLSEPCLLLGVSLGVICNHVFPEWLTTSIFALFLAWTTSMSVRNGLARWRQESREIEMRRNVESREEGCENVGGTVPLLGEETQEDSRVGIPWMKMVVLVLIWCSFCLVYLLRGNRYAKGIADIKPCGVGYWVLTSLPIPLAIVYTTWILCKDENLQQHTLNEKDNEEMSKLEPVNKLAFPAMALLAGILGGLFGLGGGMLISPLLLHVGIPPEVTAATCCFMVFFSSSMSSFQYLLLGMEHVDAALVFAFACFVASLLGLLVLQRAIKNYGRASLIVFSVSLVMALSTVLMTTFGMLRVWSDFKSGRYMGFREPC